MWDGIGRYTGALTIGCKSLTPGFLGYFAGMLYKPFAIKSTQIDLSDDSKLGLFCATFRALPLSVLVFLWLFEPSHHP